MTDRGQVVPGSSVRLWVVVVSLALGPVLYGAAPAAWRGLGLSAPGRTDLPFRDPLRYWLTPWKQDEDSARQFARAAIQQLPVGESSVIIADPTSYYALQWHWRLRPLRSHVLLDSQVTPQTVPPGTKHVYCVSDAPGYHPSWLDRVADLRKGRPQDALYRVIWKPAATEEGQER